MGRRDPVGSDRAELRILREIGVFIADGTRPIAIWRCVVFVFASELVTKRAELALKRVNLTVPTKDHA
jgi:hypothetical protein